MRSRKSLASAVAVVSAAVLVISACSKPTTNKSEAPVGATGAFVDCATKPNDCNSGKAKSGGTFAYVIEKKIKGWNANDSGSNTVDFHEVVGGILPSAFIAHPDLGGKLNDDLLASAEMTGTSPQTIVYKIKPEAVWDDGTAISADDFVYAWHTRNGTTCRACRAASVSGYDQMRSVTGSDGGKTVTVVYETPFADWQEQFGTLYPAHIAKQHGDLAASWKWFNETVPTFSGGPYKITEYQADQSVTEVPNPRWYGAVKPSLDKLIYRIITDQTQQVPALRNNEVQALYSQPNLDLVKEVKGLPNVQYMLGKGLSWEHVDINTENKFLAAKPLRQAVFLAINRQDIIKKTVGEFVPDVQPLNSHNFVPAQKGYQDVVSATGAGKGDATAAKKVLADAGYKVDGAVLKTPTGEPVTLSVTYAEGNVLRKATAELIQSQLAPLGIKVDIISTADLGDVLDNGKFDLVIFGWTGQPWVIGGALQLWHSTSPSNYSKLKNAESDRLLDEAGKQTDAAKAAELVNQANEIMAKEYNVLPLFQKPTFLAVQNQFVNIRDNATTFRPSYNNQAWGVRAS